MNDKPNLIERLENLLHSIEEIRTEVADTMPASVLALNAENAYGIAGEILTMIDGR